VRFSGSGGPEASTRTLEHPVEWCSPLRRALAWPRQREKLLTRFGPFYASSRLTSGRNCETAIWPFGG